MTTSVDFEAGDPPVKGTYERPAGLGKDALASAYRTRRRAMATQTSAQRRREEALAYQEFVRTCPTARLLDRIADKWVTLVLEALSDGSRRYAEVSRAVPGASQKMLTQTLRQLERDGLLARQVAPAPSDRPAEVRAHLVGSGVS